MRISSSLAAVFFWGLAWSLRGKSNGSKIGLEAMPILGIPIWGMSAKAFLEPPCRGGNWNCQAVLRLLVRDQADLMRLAAEQAREILVAETLIAQDAVKVVDAGVV